MSSYNIGIAQESGTMLFICVGGFALVVLLHALRYLRSPLNKIPGPLLARFTNLPLKMAVISGNRCHYVHTLHERYGPLVRIAPNEVAVADVPAFKKIHGVASGFEKSPWYKEFNATQRAGVFDMTDVKMHAARRRLLSRGFSKTHLRQHWEAAVQKKVQLAMSRVRDEARAAGSADILKWFTFLASDVSTQLMFGQDFESLERGEVSDYIRLLQRVMMGSGIGAELPWLRLIGSYLPLRICRELWQVHDQLYPYGSLAVTNMKQQQGATNIFSNMMAAADKGERLDDQDVRVEAQNLIVAGTDTTSVTLTYLVWVVCSRPDLQRRVEEEVARLPDGFREADVEQLELLNAVIEETLRLYGAAPGALPRMVPPGGTSISDYYLPQGTTVTTQAFTYHRNESLFPEALSYVPERWMISQGEQKYRISDAARSVYSPFGSGSRSCLGIHLAYMELRLGAAEFFRTCAGARLASSTTPESMGIENFFLIAPVAHKCEIIVPS